MPGPAPKDASLRARRNKTSTAAKLDPDHNVEVPELPPRMLEVRLEGKPPEMIETDWHPQAMALWLDVWASPMAPEYLDADVHGIHVLVALTDAYWRRMESGQVSGANELAKEIRLQRQAYGLSPIDRRRLQWEVGRGEEAEERRTKRQRQMAEDAKRPEPVSDPRLSLVQ